MKLVYGIHKPRYVSDTGVVSYSEHLGLQGEIYRLKDYSDESWSKYRYLGGTIPDVLIFNSKGLLTKFAIDCSSDLDSLAKLIPEDIDSMVIAGKTLEDFFADTYVIHAKNNKEIIAPNTPLYVVKFAEYAGKLNKENVPEQIRLLSSREDVRYILLNMDYTRH